MDVHMILITHHFAGETEELGKFTIKFPQEMNGKSTRLHYAKTQAEGLHKLTDAAKKKMRAQKGKRNEVFYFLDDNISDSQLTNAKTDVIFYQVIYGISILMEFKSLLLLSRICG